VAGRRDGGSAAVLNGPGTLSASIGFWSALAGLVCALLMVFAPDAAFDTMAFAPFVALGALVLAIPFAIAGLVRADARPVRRLAWASVAVWAVGTAAFGWGWAQFMDELV
jgi:hypothetical protein